MLIWKPIAKCPQFEISNDGQIKNTKTRKILKQNVLNEYNAVVTKVGGRKGINIVFRVHRELAIAFIPNPENKPCANHIDGNKLNNSLDNLEWCTHSENSIHAVKLGLCDFDSIRGENNSKSILTEDLIKKIKSEVIPNDRNFGYRALARKYNIARSTVLGACSSGYCDKNKKWKHL